MCPALCSSHSRVLQWLYFAQLLLFIRSKQYRLMAEFRITPRVWAFYRTTMTMSPSLSKIKFRHQVQIRTSRLTTSESLLCCVPSRKSSRVARSRQSRVYMFSYSLYAIWMLFSFFLFMWWRGAQNRRRNMSQPHKRLTVGSVEYKNKSITPPPPPPPLTLSTCRCFVDAFFNLSSDHVA